MNEWIFVLLLGFGSMRDPRSLTRDRNHAPAMEAQSLNHWTSRAVLQMNYLLIFLMIEELAILAIRVSY